MTNYKKAIEILTSSGKFYINLGLDRIGQILDLLGNPQDDLRIIHVAGTNGKGSVSAILSAVLGAKFKVGLFTSPHIFDYVERVKVFGPAGGAENCIAHETFAQMVLKICELARVNKIHLTEFEILTALTFEFFREEKVDYVVLETGLGGRFDATNIIKNNLCSVIVNLDLDHTERLGDTIDKIAFEKAGIIKASCPVVISADNKGLAVIKTVAAEKGASVIECVNEAELFFSNGQNFAKIDGKDYEFGLLGLYQAQNLNLAISALRVLNLFDETSLAQGLKSVRHFARMSYDNVQNVLIDGAHNPDGARVLRESLDYYFPNQKFRFVFGCLNNKDYKSMMKILFNAGDEVFLYQFNNKNSASVDELKKNCEIEVLEEFDKTDRLTVVCGSFYMIDEVLSKIGVR